MDRARLRTADFDAVYRQGCRRTTTRFLVLARPNGRARTRCGISVKKALGGAVLRNRIKRRVRAILRRAQGQLPAGWDIVVQPRSDDVARAHFARLEAELTRVLAAVADR
jgi:ribonuclease P protein component